MWMAGLSFGSTAMSTCFTPARSASPSTSDSIAAGLERSERPTTTRSERSTRTSPPSIV